MNKGPDTPLQTKENSMVARIGWAVLIVATLYVCYFSHLGAIGFVGPDEPRYAWVARDMAETGDWVTPRLYGKPWFEKPPLYYWGAALCFKFLGVSETAARLPSAVSALLATLALAWLALRVYGLETARWLLLLLPTTIGMIGFSHAAATDMPFAGMLTIAMVCAAVLIGLVPSVTRTSSKFFPSILFGFFLALAVLAKGPAGLILCSGGVFLWALFTKRWRDAFRLLHPAAIVAFCATALPWYILCARRNPDFFRVFIIEHNFKRYLTPEFQHIQPFWFYVPIVLLAFLPWTVSFLVLAFRIGVTIYQRSLVPAIGVYFASWALFCLLFFSISQSKLPGYILPSVFPCGFALAHLHSRMPNASKKGFRIVLLLGALFFCVLSAIVAFVTPSVLRGNEPYGIAIALTIAAMGSANLILGITLSTRQHGAFKEFVAGCCVLPILVALSYTDKLSTSFFRWDPSGRSIAGELNVRKIPAEELQVCNMQRGLHYSLNFYLKTEVQDWNPRFPKEGYLIVNSKICAQVTSPDFKFEEVPFDLRNTGVFVFRVSRTHLTANVGPGGQAQ